MHSQNSRNIISVFAFNSTMSGFYVVGTLSGRRSNRAKANERIPNGSKIQVAMRKDFYHARIITAYACTFWSITTRKWSSVVSDHISFAAYVCVDACSCLCVCVCAVRFVRQSRSESILIRKLVVKLNSV